MATITGLTAERMIQTENKTVISGFLFGTHLVLVQKDGSQIDVGVVKGATGAQGPQGIQGVHGTNGTNGTNGTPGLQIFADAAARAAAIPSPTHGIATYLVSTGAYEIYQDATIAGSGNAGWYPPWGTAWGNIDGAYRELTSPSIPITGPGNLSGLAFEMRVPQFRRVEFKVNGHLSLDGGGAGEARLHLMKDDTTELVFFTQYVPTANRGFFLEGTYEWISDGALHTWNIDISRSSGTAHAYVIAGANLKSIFSAKDIGPQR